MGLFIMAHQILERQTQVLPSQILRFEALKKIPDIPEHIRSDVVAKVCRFEYKDWTPMRANRRTAKSPDTQPGKGCARSRTE